MAVFRAFDRLQQRARPTGNQPDDQTVRNAKRRGHSEGIQYAKPTTGARAHIDDTSAELQRLQRIHHTRNVRQVAFTASAASVSCSLKQQLIQVGNASRIHRLRVTGFRH